MSPFSTHQRLNVKHASESVYPLPSAEFCNWLAGVTDGDGSFSFSVNKKILSGIALLKSHKAHITRGYSTLLKVIYSTEV